MRKQYEHTVMPFLESDMTILRSLQFDEDRNIEASGFDNIREINRKITAYYGYDEEHTFLRTRKREVVQVRQLVHTFCYFLTKNTLGQIGVIGSADHSTVIHSLKVVRDLYDTELIFRNDVENIAQIFNMTIPDLKASMKKIPV